MGGRCVNEDPHSSISQHYKLITWDPWPPSRLRGCKESTYGSCVLLIFPLSLFGNKWLLRIGVIGEAPQATCCDTLWALSWLVLAPHAQGHNEKTQFSREKTSQTACLPFTQHGGIKNGWAPHPLFQPPNGKICIKPWVSVWVKINKSNMHFSVSCLFFLHRMLRRVCGGHILLLRAWWAFLPCINKPRACN